MGIKTLGISWLNGRFHAVVLAGRKQVAVHSSPEPVPDEAAFHRAVSEAVLAMKLKSARVHLVLDHRSLLFHVQETPPISGKPLRQVLDRQVARNRFFEEEATWIHTALPAAKGRQRFLLALAPRPLIEQLSDACESNGLRLEGVYPLAVVLQEELKHAATQPSEVILLASPSGESLHLVLGTGTGQILFARTLAGFGGLNQERAVQEINRTLHYAEQQFSAKVARLAVLGTSMETALQGIPLPPGLALQACTMAEDETYHARRVALLARRAPLNLLPKTASQVRRQRQWIAAALAALVMVSVSIFVGTELLARAREHAAQNQARCAQTSSELREEALGLTAEGRRLQAWIETVGATNDIPVSSWFARYLGTITPETIRLTHFNVTRSSEGWALRLDGMATDVDGGYITLIEHFEHELTEGVFHVTVSDSTHHRLVHGNPDGDGAPRPVTRERERAFFIAGMIR